MITERSLTWNMGRSGMDMDELLDNALASISTMISWRRRSKDETTSMMNTSRLTMAKCRGMVRYAKVEALTDRLARS